MKLKTTRKNVLDFYSKDRVLAIPYCAMQNLLRYREAFAYTSGTNGWNNDIYKLDNGVAICTGYRTFGKKVPYAIINRYEKQATKINDTNIDWNKRKEKVEKLLNDFISEALTI